MRSRLVLALTILLLTTGCGLLSPNRAEAEFCADPAALVQGFGQITLPASYESLDVQCSVFMDHHAVYARFEIAPADLAAFQQSTLIETWLVKPETPPDLPYGFGDYLDDRAIANLMSYFYGVHEPIVPVAQQILIDTSDPQRYVVYFTAFTSY